MWFRDKKPERPKVVFNKEHIWRELIPTPETATVGRGNGVGETEFGLTWDSQSGRVGGLTINTKDHGPIDIELHAKDGYLVEMEVLWYFFPKVIPRHLGGESVGPLTLPISRSHKTDGWREPHIPD